jgi:hypothetical protein
MLRLVRRKFKASPFLQQLLLSTGDKPMFECSVRGGKIKEVKNLDIALHMLRDELNRKPVGDLRHYFDMLDGCRLGLPPKF